MSELVLRNRQRVRALDLRRLRRITRLLLEDLLGLRSYELGVHFVAVPEITRLNETFLEHAGSTDVITFDHSEPSAGPGLSEAGGLDRPEEPSILQPSTGRTVPGEPPSARLSQHRLGRDAPPDRKRVPPAGTPPPRRRTSRLEPALNGEIFICLEEAVVQARRFGTTWQSEVVRYLVHGVLHARGHDDLDAVSRRRMKREEDRLLQELTGRFRLSQLARRPRVRS